MGSVSGSRPYCARYSSICYHRGFHLLSLKTGEQHPLAAIPVLSESHLMHFLVVEEFQLSIAQDYLPIPEAKHEPVYAIAKQAK